MKIWLVGRLFLLITLSAGWNWAHAGYIESTVWDSNVVSLEQNQLELKVNISYGPGGYYYDIFRYGCAPNEKITSMLNYVIVPKRINISGVYIDVKWVGTNQGETIDGNWILLGDVLHRETICTSGGAGRYSADVSVTVRGTGRLDNLPPGDYVYSLSYYVGNAFGISDGDAVEWARLYALDGALSQTSPVHFTGAAACGQDSSTTGATIDFSTVTSNGTIQQGPLTTLGLVCNYDVALNDVTYSLTSNNPVSGEPSTGHSVAVKLSNGATVRLDGGNVTQPDPKKVSVNITPSIDTQGAIAGEGSGSATLTFNYE